MIQEAHELPPAMLAVVGGFVTLFLIIAMATVATVMAGAGQAPPSIDALPLPGGITVVDRRLTCSPDVCDGEASVVVSPGMGAAATLAMIGGRLQSISWTEQACSGAMCLAQGDLRIRLAVWEDLEPDAATAAMRTHLGESGKDQSGFVFVHVRRCGVLTPCE